MQITGVAQPVERATFNRVVRGSIPLISISGNLGSLNRRRVLLHFSSSGFVRLAQSAEHRSYEPKVGSSILPANTFGAACGAFIPMWSRWL